MESEKMFPDKLRETGLKQKELAELLGISVSVVSQLLSGKQKPTKQHEIAFQYALGERKPYINPTIEAVAQIMEQLPPEAQAEVLKAAEKEKVFVEAGRGK
jgi:predicted transcriptional regulator